MNNPEPVTNTIIVASSNKYRPFADAREFVKSLGLQSYQEWRKYIASGSLPHDIPRVPNYVYRSDWKGFVYWLGYKEAEPAVAATTAPPAPPAPVQYLSYEEAKKWIGENLSGFGIRKIRDWRSYVTGLFINAPEIPAFIPKMPFYAYKNSGWKGWGDFFGYITNGKKKRGRRPDIVLDTPADSPHPDIIMPVVRDHKPQPIIDRKPVPEGLFTYDEARAYLAQHVVHRGVNTLDKYFRWVRGYAFKTITIDPRISRNPTLHYEDTGWVSWDHYLSIGMAPGVQPYIKAPVSDAGSKEIASSANNKKAKGSAKNKKQDVVTEDNSFYGRWKKEQEKAASPLTAAEEALLRIHEEKEARANDNYQQTLYGQ